jgi:hypothetical protein
VAQAGATDHELTDYVRVAQSPVLALPPDGDAYVGIYWDPSTATVKYTPELAAGVEEALSAFRAFMHESGS